MFKFTVSILAIIGLLATTALSQSVECRIRSVCYAIDQSGSVTQDQYMDLQEFTKATARALVMLAPANTLYSAIAFSTETKTIQAPTTDVEGTFVPAIDSSINDRFGSFTNIYDGMRECRANLGDGADDEARVMVIVTDGQQSTDAELNSSPTNPIEGYKAEGIIVITVGVGSGTDVDLLKQWATGPQYAVQTSFQDIASLAMMIPKAACDAVLPQYTPYESPEEPPSLRDTCQAAYEACNFTLGNDAVVPEYVIDLPNDAAFTSRIYHRNTNKAIGIVNSGKFDTDFVGLEGPVQDYGMQPFAPTAFYAVAIDTDNGDVQEGSGIAHQALQGNQLLMAKGRCVRVFFNAYQTLFSNGEVASNINIDTKDPKACVAFLTAP